MPAKLERCVQHVKASKAGRSGRVNPWAVCQASVMGKGKGKKKKGKK